MKHQVELDETELLVLAKKQLISDGVIPPGGGVAPLVYLSRSTESDDRGQYTFIFRWEAPEP